MSKPSLAFVPALKTFDTGLQKCGFTGAGAKHVKTIVTLNTALTGILSHIQSVKSFESQFSALLPKYLAAQTRSRSTWASLRGTSRSEEPTGLWRGQPTGSSGWVSWLHDQESSGT